MLVGFNVSDGRLAEGTDVDVEERREGGAIEGEAAGEVEIVVNESRAWCTSPEVVL